MNKKTEKRLQMALQTAAFSIHSLLISSIEPSTDGATLHYIEKSLMAAIKAVDSISKAIERLQDNNPFSDLTKTVDEEPTVDKEPILNPGFPTDSILSSLDD